MGSKLPWIVGGGALLAWLASRSTDSVSLAATDTTVLGDGTMHLTADQLSAAAHPRVDSAGILDGLNRAADYAEINTPERWAMFLAQVGHESGGFYYRTELWGATPTVAQARYEPPGTKADELGNTEEGDGFRYRGRGFLQITGRGNYAQIGNALGQDFEGNPDLVADDPWAAMTAAYYWKVHKLNKYADAGDVSAASGVINCGSPRCKANNLDDRIARYNTAAAALGIATYS